LATYSRGKNFVLILTWNCLGYILGDFFTKAFGHPESKQPYVGNKKAQ
jgi:hypothetical protein